MAAHDAVVRRLAATVASNAYRAGPGRRRVRRPGLPEDLASHYLSEVDPSCVLDGRERQSRATAAWRRDVALQALAEYKATVIRDSTP